MRGISILLVLGRHFAWRRVPGGYFGVDIFFVLSGFLITSLLLQEWARQSSISLKDFYIRRALRLGPALIVYLLALGAYALVFLKQGNAHQIYAGILWTLSYVSNWVMAFKPGQPLSILAITWSLAIEEQFYLVWPLLLSIALKSKLNRRWIIIVLAVGVVCVIAHRALLWKAGAPLARMYYGTDTHSDGLLFGCLIGCLTSWDLLRKSRRVGLLMKSVALIATVGFVYLVLTMSNDDPFLYAGGFALISLAISLALLTLLVWPPAITTTLLRFGPLVWVGRISYGLYLWHWAVRGLVFGKSLEPSTKQIVAALILSLAITSLSFYLIERPFLRWKKRFSHVRDSASLAAASDATVKG